MKSKPPPHSLDYVLAAGLWLLACSAAVAQAASPTTAPDEPADLSQADLSQVADNNWGLTGKQLDALKAMCRQLHQRRWGEPIEETFLDLDLDLDLEPDPGGKAKTKTKNPWTASGGKLAFKDGEMVFTLAGGQRRLAVLKIGRASCRERVFRAV